MYRIGRNLELSIKKYSWGKLAQPLQQHYVHLSHPSCACYIGSFSPDPKLVTCPECVALPAYEEAVAELMELALGKPVKETEP